MANLNVDQFTVPQPIGARLEKRTARKSPKVNKNSKTLSHMGSNQIFNAKNAPSSWSPVPRSASADRWRMWKLPHDALSPGSKSHTCPPRCPHTENTDMPTKSWLICRPLRVGNWAGSREKRIASGCGFAPSRPPAPPLRRFRLPGRAFLVSEQDDVFTQVFQPLRLSHEVQFRDARVASTANRCLACPDSDLIPSFPLRLPFCFKASRGDPDLTVVQGLKPCLLQRPRVRESFGKLLLENTPKKYACTMALDVFRRDEM